MNCPNPRLECKPGNDLEEACVFFFFVRPGKGLAPRRGTSSLAADPRSHLRCLATSVHGVKDPAFREGVGRRGGVRGRRLSR